MQRITVSWKNALRTATNFESVTWQVEDYGFLSIFAEGIYWFINLDEVGCFWVRASDVKDNGQQKEVKE